MEFNIDTVKIGQCVSVKKGVKDPDFGYPMDGWQGIVTEISKNDGLIDIKWDGKTLLDTPTPYLQEIISGGYDYELMTLSIKELEPATKRPTTTQETSAFAAKIYWIDFYGIPEIDEDYAEIFKGVDVKNTRALFERWMEHLNDELQFPFETEVAETEGRGPRLGTKIKLLALDDYDDLYGILGIGKSEGGAVTFPICNLEAVDKDSDNYGLLENYVFWFANR